MTERELRRRLRALADRDSAAAPPFERVWRAAEARATARAPRWPARAAAALGVTAFGVWLLRPAPAPDLEAALSDARALAAWEAPLDFLLDTPGRDFIDSAPTFGAVDVGPPLPEGDRS